MAVQASAPAETQCVCKHSMSAHGLHGDAGCSFCGCRRFERPKTEKQPVELGKYPAAAFDLLSKNPAYRSVDPNALIAFVKDGRGRMYAAGACLVSRGERCSALHVVLSGNVLVQPQEPRDAKFQAGPGHIAGDLRAFTEDPRWAGVYAVDSVLALEVDTARIRTVFNEHQDLFMSLVQNLAKFSANIDEVINATVEAMIEQHELEEAAAHRGGLDPQRQLEVAARWRKLKEEDKAAADRAREVARVAIDSQTKRR